MVKLFPNYKPIVFFLTMAILLFSNNSNAWSLFGPSTREECILENMKGVTNNDAAYLIATSCYAKFPIANDDKSCKLRELSSAEKKNLTSVNMQFIGNDSSVAISIHNGNNISIDEIEFSMISSAVLKPQTYIQRIYSSIAPKSSGEIFVKVQKLNWGSNVGFSIGSIKTCSK